MKHRCLPSRTIGKAAVKPVHDDSHDRMRTYFAEFMATHSFSLRLRTLSGLIPHDPIAKLGHPEPDRFIVDPIHQVPGLNS